MSLNLAFHSMANPASVNISDLNQAYARGENISHLLSVRHPDLKQKEVIEIAYDIQSGIYSKIALANQDQLKQYAQEMNSLCKDYIIEEDIILDCGAGELATLSALSQHLPQHRRLMTCDISLSRLRMGQRFAAQFMRADLAADLELFVADMGCMPLTDDCVDVVFTSPALEPNHGREASLLKELLRIARRHLILFEPSREHANEAIWARIAEHGYVRDLPHHIEEEGGRLASVQPLPHSLNLMNPTFCYVVETSNQSNPQETTDHFFQCPRSGFPLHQRTSNWWSREGGWAYPEIEGISCLRAKHGVMMSHG